MTARNLHRLHDNILQIQFLPYSWYVSPANRAAMRVCGDFLSISVSGLSENGNQRQRKLSETARTVGRSGSAGAEKRQPFILPIFRCAESLPKSAPNRAKQPGPLSLPSRAPVCPHSGPQGRMRGFRLRYQLLLRTVTLDSSLDQIKRCRLCCSTACSGFSLSTAMQLLGGVNCHGNLQPEQNVSCFEIYICTPWFARMHLKWSILSTVCRKCPLKISHC